MRNASHTAHKAMAPAHHSTRVLLISFIILCSLGCHQLARAAEATSPRPAASSTRPPASAEETTTAAPASDETTTTIKPTADGPAGDKSTEEPEPITSTTDSIGVGDAADAKSDSDDEADTATTTETSTTGDEADADKLPGIAGKSISRDSDANSVGKDEKSAELNIEPEEAPERPTTANTAANSEKVRPSLNMTQIDREYVEGRTNEEQSVENWKRLNKKLKKGISGVIGSMVPFALNMSQEAKISSNCSGAMLKWILSMNQLKAWALRMLDASGKPIAGLLEGSMTMFGNYRQCLKVRAPDDDEIEFAGEFREYFRGKYCVIQAKPWLPEKSRFYNLNTKLESLVLNEEDNQLYDRTIFDELSEWLLAFNFVDIRFDLCVPSLCKREDIQKAINYLLKGIDLKARVLRCEMDRPDGSLGVASQVESGTSEIAEALVVAEAAKNLTVGASPLNLETVSRLGWLLMPAMAVLLVLVATALSMTIGDQRDEKTTKLKHTIHSLSLKRSVRSHLSVDYDQLADDKPLALYGIRFLLVLWVILVESAVNLKFEYLRELMMLKDLIFWWPMQFVINSTMQYDSFILLTAFTMAYKNCLNDGINQTKAMTRFVLDKYVRLMPSVMVMVALVILLPMAYRGPVWNDYVARQSAVCHSTGWVNSVFLQNYLPFKDICLPQTWLLCVEFQLVLLMAPILYYLNKSYISNYGQQKGRKGSLGNGLMNNSGPAKGSQLESDSSRAFFWLATTPGTLLITCIVFGLASSFYNVYYNELPPSWFYTMADPDSKALYFGEHMTRIWTHMAVFAMGLLAGVECRRMSKNRMRQSYRGANLGLSSSASHIGGRPAPKSLSSSSLHNSSVSIDISNSTTDDGLNSSSDIGIYNAANNQADSAADDDQGPGCCTVLAELVGFVAALAVMGGLIFSTHEWSLNELPRPLVAGLFDAASRFLWSLALIWILYGVSVPDARSGRLSALARALGHPGLVCLGKLSFLIYIIHPFVHTAVLAIQEQPIYSSWLMMFHILIGNITITVILSSLVSLFVEMPCRNLFRRCGASLLLTQAAATSGSTTVTGSTSLG